MAVYDSSVDKMCYVVKQSKFISCVQQKANTVRQGRTIRAVLEKERKGNTVRQG